jgi:hypothetical protein
MAQFHTYVPKLRSDNSDRNPNSRGNDPCTFTSSVYKRVYTCVRRERAPNGETHIFLSFPHGARAPPPPPPHCHQKYKRKLVLFSMTYQTIERQSPWDSRYKRFPNPHCSNHKHVARTKIVAPWSNSYLHLPRYQCWYWRL